MRKTVIQIGTIALMAFGNLLCGQNSVQVSDNGAHRTLACNGQDTDSVQVSGNDNSLRLTGKCGSLQVSGNNNQIQADALGSLQFSGNGNHVRYRLGSRPTLSDTGTNNALQRAAADGMSSSKHMQPSGGSSAVAQDDNTSVSGSVGAAVASALGVANGSASAAGNVQAVQRNGNELNLAIRSRNITESCQSGESVNLNGNQNNVTLTGNCGSLHLNGFGNKLQLEQVGRIEVVGHDNSVTWMRSSSGKRPVVQIIGGSGNSVRQADSGGK